MSPTLIGALGLLLLAQQPGASIEGFVRDGATGDPLAGAVVALTDLNRSTVTGEHGGYALLGVGPGPQHVTVRRIGYEPRVLHALVPSRGRLEVDVALRAVPARLGVVTIRPTRTVQGIERGDRWRFPDRAMTLAAIGDHPLLSEADAFLALGGGEAVTRAESPTGMHVRGGAADQTGYVIDGIPVFSPYHAAGMFSSWNPDALEVVELSSVVPRPEHPDALSGTVEGRTRTPGDHVTARGSISTTQARITLDGPLGRGGYLVSARSGFPGALTGVEEASYLSGETSDRLVKLELPASGGQARLIVYSSEDEIGAAARAGATHGGTRHQFEWHAQSIGGEWRRATGAWQFRALGWRALGNARSQWMEPSGAATMASERRDLGALASVQRATAHSSTLLGVRVTRSGTAYRADADSTAGLRLAASTPMFATFAQYTRELRRRTSIELGSTIAAAAGGAHVAPRARLRWDATEALAVSASWTRTHQFAQSLRNAESIVGMLLPADLYVGAGGRAVPVARSDLAVVAASLRPTAGAQVGLQLYGRSLDGLLLVAPREPGPFATSGFETGSGQVRGLVIDASMAGARHSVRASYGFQRVRTAAGDSRWTPEHAATHVVEGGATVHATGTLAVRIGATGAAGRRTTSLEGDLEWEACNLLDAGCEFAGSPRLAGSVGDTPLPAYLRIDVGVRKHWHVALAGRPASVALFATVSNLLGRTNVLTYARPSPAADPAAVEMRPLTPLVVGLDWRF